MRGNIDTTISAMIWLELMSGIIAVCGAYPAKYMGLD